MLNFCIRILTVLAFATHVAVGCCAHHGHEEQEHRRAAAAQTQRGETKLVQELGNEAEGQAPGHHHEECQEGACQYVAAPAVALSFGLCVSWPADAPGLVANDSRTDAALFCWRPPLSLTDGTARCAWLQSWQV